MTLPLATIADAPMTTRYVIRPHTPRTFYIWDRIGGYYVTGGTNRIRKFRSFAKAEAYAESLSAPAEFDEMAELRNAALDSRGRP